MRVERYKLVVYDPVGQPATLGDARPPDPLDSMTGKAVGFLFNGHPSALKFWNRLELVAEEVFQPRQTFRVYKEDVGAQAPPEKMAELVRGSDYAFVGVAA